MLNRIDKYFSVAVLGLITLAAFFAAWFYFKYGLVEVNKETDNQINTAGQKIDFKSDEPIYRQAVWGAVGDIMLSRNVAKQIKISHQPLTPFSLISDWLLENDFNFGNLESLFTGSGFIPPTNSLLFNAYPDSLPVLESLKFKVLGLANNHALDYGLAAINYTKELLTNNGMVAAGVGQNLNKAWQPAIVEINDIKIAFIAASYTSFNDNGRIKNDYVARLQDVDNLNKSIIQAKQGSDYVVVSMHAGQEYTLKLTSDQIAFARQAIDSGADIVIGHHPHWRQSSEFYKGKPIYYSLGNFVFDQMWSLKTRQGLALRLTVKQTEYHNQKNTSLIKLEEFPVIIDNYAWPRLDGPGVNIDLKID